MLPRVPSERRHRRRQPGRRAPHRPPAGRSVLRVARRLADALAGDAPEHRRSGGVRRRRPHVPHLDQHARARASSRPSPTARCSPSAIAAGGDARHRGHGPGARGDGAARIGRFGWKNQHASLESFAADAYLNEMGITSPLFPDENTVERPRASPPTTRSPIPRTTASTSSRSPTSCDPPRRRRAARSRRTCRPASAVRHESAARPATCRRSPPRPPGTRRSTAAPSPSRPALGNKIIHPVQRLPVARHRHRRRHSRSCRPPEFAEHREPDSHGAALGAAHAQPADARRPVVHARRRRSSATAVKPTPCGSASTR